MLSGALLAVFSQPAISLARGLIHKNVLVFKLKRNLKIASRVTLTFDL